MKPRPCHTRLVALTTATALTLAFLPSFAQPVPAAAAAVPVPAPDASPGASRDGNAALSYWLAFALMPEADQQQQVIDAWTGEHSITDAPGKVSADPKVIELLGSATAELDLLRRGARMGHCDWGLDYAQGPELLMPHLAMGRQLATLAALRARHRFEEGRPREGVVDALLAMKLGRDVGSDPILIAVLVQYGIQSLSIDILARHLPALDAEELGQLAQTIEELPMGDRLGQVWDTERRFMVDWFEERLKQQAENGQGEWAERVLAIPTFDDASRKKLREAGVPPLEKALAQLGEIRAYYADLEKLTDGPPDALDAGLAAANARVSPDNLLFRFLAPNVDHVFRVRRLDQARKAMLNAAVAVQRDGPGRLQENALADPFGDGPFEYRKTADGFDLLSKLTRDGEPVTLSVGIAKPE
jgi:hypothetical protein